MPTWNGSKNTQHNAELGNEPAIFAADSRTIAHPGLLTHIVDTREREQVPYKIRQPRGGGTEAGSMQLANQGIPRTTISPPARYIQTAVGMASISDWHARLRLVHTGPASSQRSLLRRIRTKPRRSDRARCRPGDQGARFRFPVGSPGCGFDGSACGGRTHSIPARGAAGRHNRCDCHSADARRCAGGSDIHSLSLHPHAV